jgi:hypothetical protein
VAVTITAASFPTPDFIKLTNNPAIWDQQARFATLQAGAANDLLARLNERLDRTSSHLERSMVFVQAWRDVTEWRYQLAQRPEGHRPDAARSQYRAEIGEGAIRDAFGRGLMGEGSRVMRSGQLIRGTMTPANLMSERLADLAQARFDAEAPDQDILQNHVRLPNGEVVNGNLLLRGQAAVDGYGIERPVDGFYCAKTGTLADRRLLQREAVSILADLEGLRAEGTVDTPDAKRAFVEAEYFLYQGPEYQRGGDAAFRVLLVASHTRIFGAAPKLPQDIDMMAYVAGQEAFHEHVHLTQVVLASSKGPAPAVAQTGQLPARVQHRNAGLERG